MYVYPILSSSILSLAQFDAIENERTPCNGFKRLVLFCDFFFVDIYLKNFIVTETKTIFIILYGLDL